MSRLLWVNNSLKQRACPDGHALFVLYDCFIFHTAAFSREPVSIGALCFSLAGFRPKIISQRRPLHFPTVAFSREPFSSGALCFSLAGFRPKIILQRRPLRRAISLQLISAPRHSAIYQSLLPWSAINCGLSSRSAFLRQVLRNRFSAESRLYLPLDG